MGEETGESVAQQDDEEWDDYRENKEDDTEVNENGEIVKKEESGPWNKREGERR